MGNIKSVLVISILLCSAFLLANSDNLIWPEQPDITISMWSFHDEVKIFIDRFEARHPNIHINLTIFPIEEYITKLWPVLLSGKNAPDLFTVEYAFIADLVESGFYDDLSAAPYKADIKDVIPYVVQVGTDSAGILRALSWQACVGGFYYRRSMAKQYLGTDDPEKIGQMLSTPEKFLAAARIIKQKSGGKVKLIGSYGDYSHYAFASRTKAFVTNNRLNIEKPILDYFDFAKTMIDEDLTAEVDTWSPPWFENMSAAEPNFMGYILPTWGWKYVLKPYVKDTSGDWGLCKGPASYFWDGSWLGIYKNSQNKEAAWKFLRFVTLDRDTQEWWARKTEDFVSNKTVINKIKNEFSDELFGNQKFYTVFAEEAQKINGNLLKKYDMNIRSFLMGAINEYVEGKVTKQEALDRFKQDVKNAFPEIIVEGYEDPKQGITDKNTEGQIVLSVWTFTDEMKKFAREFEQRNPGIKIDLTIVACEDYLSKIRPVLRSGKNAPDIFLAEYAFIADLVESGYYEDLSAAPYRADVKDVIPYLLDVATDSQGRLRALSWQAVPGGIFYRRSVAKEYLGTDDPEKVGQMLSTPEKFLAAARIIKQKSGGKMKLLAGYGDYNVFAFAGRSKAFVTNGILNIEKPILDYFDLAKSMRDEHLTAEIGTWSPPWFDNMNKKEPDFMGYVLPTWGLHYVIRPNADKTIGDWGLCRGPVSYFWGGSWMGIYKNSSNKEAAWKFVKYVTLDPDSQERWAKDTRDFISNRAVINKIKNDFSDPLLAGQNPYLYFASECLKINGNLLKKYELDCRGFIMGAINNYVEGKVSKEEALKQFKSDVKNAFPEIIVGGSAATEDKSSVAKEAGKTVISIWSFTDEVEKYIDEFEKRNPDIQIELTIVPCEEYLNKIRPVLRSGRNAPDVFTAEYSSVVDLVESKFYEDLSAPPYNADTSELFPCVVDVGTDSKGRLRALSWQVSVGGFYYRRSVAKKYLGTDDPEKIGQMLSTPEKFLATARILKKKSGGRVKLISSYNEYKTFAFACRSKAFVTKGRLNVEESILEYFDQAKTMKDEDLTANIDIWSPPWFENMNKEDPDFMGYILPTWGQHYVIRPNAKNNVGDWGLCSGPTPYFWGGTWLGIYEGSQNKEEAWRFVKFVTLDRHIQEWWAKETGDFISNKVIVEKIKKYFSDPLLAGQNHYAFFASEAPKINGNLLKKYELDCRNFLMEAVNDYVEGKVTKEAALEQFKREVKDAFPEIIVE
jgi:multiple sugar transport system substrate-binding protein